MSSNGHRVCAVIEAGEIGSRNPLLGPLGQQLAVRKVQLLTWDPTMATALPPVAPRADLYLIKADDPGAISAAACLADAGAAMLNSAEATLEAHDKVRMTSRLLAAGLPVPRSFVVSERGGLAGLLDGGSLFVKPAFGSHGAGAAKLGPGQADLAGTGPWLVQDVIGSGSEVVKAYGVGPHVALRRMLFRPGVLDGRREPVTDARLEALALRAAEVADLRCFGVDFIPTPDGPVIVDLNAFPGYRSVPEAPEWITQLVVTMLAGSA